MKNLFTLLLLSFVTVLFAQNDPPEYIKNAVDKYYRDIGISIDRTKLPKIEFLNSDDKNIRQQNANGKDGKMLLTPAAINHFFASEISSYVTSSKDLTFQKAYAVLSTSDKTLFLGGTFDTRKDDTDAVSFLLTTGIKAKVDDDFTSIYKNGKLQNDLGFIIKFHWIGNGSIYYEGEQEEKMSTFRENAIEKLIKEAVYDNASDDKTTKEKQTDFYKKIAKEEVDYIRKFRLYTLSTDHWFSFETYIPVSPRQYEIINDISTTDVKKENFYPWYITAGATKYWKWSSGKSCYISGFGNIKNNNTIETEALTKYTLPVYSPENSSLIEENKTVYGGDFQQFITPSLSAEFVSFFVLDGTFGFSSGVDKTFGKYDTLNWKLGVPFSLKDKEGKPSVNFELVWKEVDKDHFVGINVGFTFGKFIQ
ncbi:hypothetical protein B0A68_10480 [Flavobacterium reichenbachii]|uniref:Outer membrane protein n=2 Tax=Flavobacterium reichenbachii TaxID=362418 RepID=A0A085ZFG0_9FLAO|nr:hypothetical protein IW19_19840 [Flavobacterium reichenbachii]OXB15149.1 hypothetical protein B0A68_10480 [Flavobacterium reichenbachii]